MPCAMVYPSLDDASVGQVHRVCTLHAKNKKAQTIILITYTIKITRSDRVLFSAYCFTEAGRDSLKPWYEYKAYRALRPLRLADRSLFSL